MTNWLFLMPPHGGARQNASYLLNALQAKIAAPSSLHTFDCKKYLSGFENMLRKPDDTIVVDLLNQSLIVQCLQYKITRCFVPALCPVTLFTLNLLKDQKISAIHWFIEDYKRAAYLMDVLPGYSWLLAVQKGPLQKICENSNCQFRYLPTAASEYCLKPMNRIHGGKKNADVAFVGFPSPYRIAFLEYLHTRKISLIIAGEGWNSYRGALSESIVCGTWVDAPYAVQILTSASIGLNISFHEPAENLLESQISPRVYDILALGTALLTEDISLLHETVGDCHYYTFRNSEEAADQVCKIRSEIDDERVRKKIRENQDIILQKHTWEKRAEQIIELCS